MSSRCLLHSPCRLPVRLVPAVALALLGLLGVPAPARAGLHYTAVTRTSIAGAEDTAPHTSELQVEGWALGSQARVELHKSDNPAARAGTWLLSRDAGRTVYLIDPAQRTYTPWDLRAMLERVGGVLLGMGPLLKVNVTDLRVARLPEADGGMVAGLPTRIFRFRITYKTMVNVLGMSTSGGTVVEQDLWITDKLRDPGLGVWLRHEPPPTGDAGLDARIAAQAGAVPGYPLRAVTVSSSRQHDGRPAVTRTNMEVIRIEAAAPPEPWFTLPDGYQEKRLPHGTEGVKSHG